MRNAALFTILSLSLAGQLALAGKSEVSQTQPLDIKVGLASPTTFVIENSVGRINVYEEQGDAVRIRAQYRGDKKASIVMDQPEPGKMKIGVEYEGGAGGGTNSIHIGGRGGSISIGGVASGVVIMGGGSVVINGQRITAGQGGVVSIGGGEVVLNIGIPAQLLGNLKVTGGAADIEVKGQFESPISASRKVVLDTQSGDIACEGVCAIGSIGISAQSGDVAVIRTQGNVKVKTQSGDIEAESNKGDITVEAQSGDISVRGQTGGSVAAKTMAGDIRLNNPDMGVVEVAHTMAGTIRGQKPASNIAKCGVEMKDPFNF